MEKTETDGANRSSADMGVTVISTMNQKGGVGKTTTTLNLGSVLALEFGKRVLMVDFDPQCSLSQGLGIDEEDSSETMFSVLGEERSIRDILVSVDLGSGTGLLDVAPSSRGLRSLENRLIGEMGADSLLRDALEPVKHDYDLIIIDCRPALGLLESNALAVSDWLIVPVLAQPYTLYALNELLNFVSLAQKRINPHVELLGILPANIDRRNKVTSEVLEEVREFFKDKMFATEIRINVAVAEVPGRGVSIFDYAPNSRGATDYRLLATEVINRVAAQQRAV